MISHFDHVTIVLRDIESAKHFFGLLGFEEAKSVVIAGQKLSDCMGDKNIKSEHVTLALAGRSPRIEVQLLKYCQPEPLLDSAIADLTKIGYNHVCFAVDDLEAELARLVALGIQPRNEVTDFHGRKLVFLRGPEEITVELAEWKHNDERS